MTVVPSLQGAKSDMRKILSLAALLALAACGGGGGSSAPTSPPPPPQQTAAPQGNLVTPQFTIIIPPKGTTSKGARKPNFVSTATKSVTITLTSVGGNPPTVTPTSVSTDVNGASCPCTVNGPPSPPGQADAYTVTTYDAIGGAGGGGNALDTGGVTFTPTVGTNNVVNVTLNGIPFSVTIGALTNQAVDTAGQMQPLTVTVKDHSGQTITGTYAQVVRITDPDPATYGASVKGTSLSGTHTGSGCTTTCVDLQTDTDTATLTYNGLAEDPVTLTSTTPGVTGGNAGTATFTPNLSAIVYAAGPSSLYTGTNPVTAPTNQGCGTTTACGVDLYALSGTGSSGTESYAEPGYTDGPYNKTLTTIDGTSCTAFASLSAADNTGTSRTDFLATATTASAGVCLRVVSDGLAAANHGTGGPAFVVTYTTLQVKGQGKRRQ